MVGITRREFIKRAAASGIAGGLVLSGLAGEAKASGRGPVGTVVDLSKCDGCKGEEVPRCVSACRRHNREKFPAPSGKMHDYWPQKKHEDWSDKKHLTNRLTPYNWTFVQRVEVERQGEKTEVFVPRRCMHCDNPACVKLCPFSAQEKTPEGPVVINPNACLGGAKCRDVCPWRIPQRQAGVGIYLKIAPEFVGGGVMYKCDLCHDLVKAGQEPACVTACPQGAISFGGKEEMRRLAQERAGEIGGFVYGEKENGGTSTFYVSPVPYEQIHQRLSAELAAEGPEPKPGFPTMPPGVGNYMDTANGTAAGFLIAPIAGVFAAGWAAAKTLKGEKK
jgi:Fe-S-cluster-containing dehydrogenase component